MLKKSLITLSFIIILVLLFPLFGNKVAQTALNSKIDFLKEKGLSILNTKSDNGYLKSQYSYKCTVIDKTKFLHYISTQTQRELPVIIVKNLNTIIVGLDIEYSNIAFEKEISLDIYPLAFTSDKKLNNFLQTKAISTHIDYNIINKNFKGFIKDIDETFVLEDGSKISFKLMNSLYYADKTFNSTIENISLELTNDKEKINVDINKLKNSLDSLEIALVTFKSQELNTRTNFNLSTFKFSSSTKTHNKKISFFSASSFKELNLSATNQNINISNFDYNLSLIDMDSIVFNEFQDVLNSMKESDSLYLQTQLYQKALQLSSKGFQLDIPNLSVENIELNNQSLKGLTLHSQLTLTQNIDGFLKLKISKQIFKVISNNYIMVNLLRMYAKNIGNDLLFDTTIKNNGVNVNGNKLAL